MMRYLFACLGVFCSLFMLFLLFIYGFIHFKSKAYLFDDVEALPEGRVALILGTSKYSRKGLNPYYQNRIEAALRLYRSGKVNYFIVSGDNRRHDYNEPNWMRHDLIKGGVPAQNIQADYAGFRTLDSILRADKVFGQKSYIIISQRFHNERAIFLSHHYGQDTIAFNARLPQSKSIRFKMFVRELGARVKAIYDLWSEKQAHHYGEPILFPKP